MSLLYSPLLSPCSGSGKSLLYSVVWDEPFLGGVSCHCSPNRGYRVPPHALLNITHGKSLQQQSTSKPTRYKQHGHYPAPTSYASAITASSSGSSDNWRRQQDGEKWAHEWGVDKCMAYMPERRLSLILHQPHMMICTQTRTHSRTYSVYNICYAS